MAMRDGSKEVGRERGYIYEFLLKKKRKEKKILLSTIKRLLLITKIWKE